MIAKTKKIGGKMLPHALVITRNLPPLVGGMERLVWHIVDELNKSYNVHVVGPFACGPLLPQGTTCNEVPLKPIYRYLLHTFFIVIYRIFCQRPHLVVAGSGLTAPFAWLAARISRTHCVVYLHGLDIEARHPFYRLLWRPFFRHFDCVLVNSHFTQRLAIQIGIPKQRIRVLHPGVTLPDRDDADSQRIGFRARHNLGDIPIMLYVGRITGRKGLAVFCKTILARILEQHPEARTLVVGDDPVNALHRGKGERAHVEAILNENGLMQTVLFLGKIDDHELSAAYFAADILVFPVQQRKNDAEGFGMVAIEAAAHDLPTVAFAAGGVTDAIADDVSGKLITAGDNKAFSEAVINLLRKPFPIRKGKDIRAFAAKFSWPRFGERLRLFCNPRF